MTKLFSPAFNEASLNDNSGNPLSGGFIYQYEAGSNSVLKDTFTTQAGDVANANPIVLDSSGRLPAAIWLTAGEAYHLVLTDSSGTTVIKGFDNITGVVASTGGSISSTTIWTALTGATYLTTTSFSVTGNETAALAIGNRARFTLTAGYVYGTISAVSFGGASTTCTVILDDGATLNSSLSLVEWSLLIKGGRTIEAGAVTYNSALTPASNTVASQLQTLATADTTTNTRIDALRKVWTASGTNTYTLSPSPAVTSLSTDAVYTVLFTNASSTAATLNVNDLGAIALKRFTSAGALEDASVTAGFVSDVAYNGSVFIVLDQPPQAAAAAAPRGMFFYTSNSTFTTPAGVYYIKVTCAGGGGGGGGTYTYVSGDSEFTVYGAGGGGGATASGYLATTPSTVYSVGVGVGGAAGTSGGPGGTGGSSSFGITTLIATGGSGGGGGNSSMTGATGGAGGNVGSTGTMVSPGASGYPSSTAYFGAGGRGAEAVYGSGGNGGGGGDGVIGGQGFVIVEY